MNPQVQRLQRIILLTEDALLAVTLTAMILLAGSQILLRNLWHTGFSWGDPTLRVLVLWLTLLGAMAATRDDNHIRIDILSRYLPAGLMIYTRRMTDLFAALVSGLMAWHSARFVILEWEGGSLLFSNVPAWSCEAIMPLGFTVMTVRFLLSALAGHPQGRSP